VGGTAPLRATLIPAAQPQAPHHVATLEELCGFLQAQSDQAAPTIEPWGWQDCTPSDPQ
jgi:hypothetical protein